MVGDTIKIAYRSFTGDNYGLMVRGIIYHNGSNIISILNKGDLSQGKVLHLSPSLERLSTKMVLIEKTLDIEFSV
jgi:hypothetical protein